MGFGYGDDEEPYFDSAQICVSGHVISAYARTQPTGNQAFCSRCGAKTVMTCPACAKPIRGVYHVPGAMIVGGYHYERPAFCPECGSPYPWTASALKAANELADEQESLDAAEKEQLKQSFDDLVKDSAQTPVAVARFKKLMLKVGQAGSEVFGKILVSVATEAAKKALWPTP